MKVIEDVGKMSLHSKVVRKDGRTIGLVPTMGYLHDGHVSLIRNAKSQTDVCILSIFVNPTQFLPGEDFEKYPRDFSRDERIARENGVDVLFCPKKEDMYPKGYSTYVNVENITEGMCGASRPGHFRGVATVVLKLFNIVKPDIAYFGQKDAQQAFVIKQLTEDLNLDILLKILPIIREKDGLAMSSRNIYLGESERADALCLHEALERAEGIISGGERDSQKIISEMQKIIKEKNSAKIDYLSIVDTESLEDASRLEKGREYLIAEAVHIGRTRLIDNTIIKV